MSSLTVAVETIDFDKFINEGILEDALKNTKNPRKCYVISDPYFYPYEEEIDVATLVKKNTNTFSYSYDERHLAGTFNEKYTVILSLSFPTTKIRYIKNSGQDTFLKVEGKFSFPKYLDVYSQSSTATLENVSKDVSPLNPLSINILGALASHLRSSAKLIGSKDKDDLYGNHTDNAIFGGRGDDNLYGKGGNDGLNGGIGDDWLDGGIGDDVILGGTGKDRLFGEIGNDILHGGADNDRLYGGTGNDKLEGGPGNDKLEGGGGNNIYHFAAYSHTGQDIIQLDPGLKGVDTIHFKGDKQYFMTKWDSQKQETRFYLFTKNEDESPLVYNGKDHITVKGYSNKRRLLVQNGVYASAEALTSHKVTYRIKGKQGTHELETFLFKGTKEVLLPAKCELVSLHRQTDKGGSIEVAGAFKKPFTDSTSTGKLNDLFLGVK